MITDNKLESLKILKRDKLDRKHFCSIGWILDNTGEKIRWAKIKLLIKKTVMFSVNYRGRNEQKDQRMKEY